MWVPPKVTQELQEETQAYKAHLLEMVHRKHAMDDFNRDLKKIDPYLELIWAPENASAPGLVPGRYHVLRHNPGAPPSLLPIVGPEGEYAEPSSRVFDALRSHDLWSSEANYDRRRRERLAEEAEARRREREEEERQEEARDRYNAAFRTSVSMTPGWSQNTAGRRGRL